MTGVLCAIRGGPQSRPTIDKAIEIAAEKGLTIYFLYVVNLEFLTKSISSRVNGINEEMESMGEFILLSAHEHAERQGVKAETIVRHGHVGEEIASLCRELQVDYVVLGQPKAKTKRDTFDAERLMKFGQRIEDETGAKIVFA